MMQFEVKIHKKSDGSFQTKFLDPKTGRRKRKRFMSLKEAKQHKTEIESRVQSKGNTAFSDLRMSQAIKLFLEKFPRTSIKNRKNHFISFVDVFGSHRVTEFTTNDFREWLEKRKSAANLSDRTMNGIKSQFYGFFEFLIEEGYLKGNPVKKVKFKRYDNPRRPRVVLAIEEVKQILANAKTFDKETLYPVLYTLAHTGARRTEILNLKRSNVDFKTNLIHLIQTKNGHERFVKMSPNLITLLREKLLSHPYEVVFPNEFSKRLHQAELTRLINKFKHFFPVEKEDWGCHSFRHSFAYNFLKAGGEMYQLQAILGHRGIQVTVDLYGQLQAQDVENPSPYNF